jgi:hypothetical protein
MTTPMDYNQHLLSYLQAWRQLLEASAAMTSTMPAPGMQSMPGMPSMPQMPGMPPMAPPGTGAPGANPPTDYTQQLFGYLQAWRQYLEQSIGAAPGMPTTPGMPTAPTTGQPTTGQPSASEPTPTMQPSGSQPTGSQPEGSSGSQSKDSTASQASGTQSSFGAVKPPLEQRPPKHPWGGTGVVDSSFPYRAGELLVTGPERRFGSAERVSGTAFAAKPAPVEGPLQAATRSLFRRAASTPSATGTPTPTASGADPRRAAPSATSRWWEAGRGERPGFKNQPDLKNLRTIRPLDLREEQ